MTQVMVVITQRLEQEEKKILQEYGLTFLEKPMVEIHLIDFVMPETIPDYLLITSQNAIKSILNNLHRELLKQCPVICVGRQTKKLLEENAWHVEYMTDYAKDMYDFLAQQRNHPNILFLNGNLRNSILVDYMDNLDIPFHEITVYETHFTPMAIDVDYQAVVFFSPSAVDSFCQSNSLRGKQVFCLGETTAKALGGVVIPMLSSYPSRKETLILCAKQLSGS